MTSCVCVCGGGGLSRVRIENWTKRACKLPMQLILTDLLKKKSAAPGINSDKKLELLIEV
jgi:hypothetical protein